MMVPSSCRSARQTLLSPQSWYHVLGPAFPVWGRNVGQEITSQTPLGFGGTDLSVAR